MLTFPMSGLLEGVVSSLPPSAQRGQSHTLGTAQLPGLVSSLPLPAQRGQSHSMISASFMTAEPTDYRMRATDTSLGAVVYWSATAVDATGAQYTGPGPLVDIVAVGVPTS